jgi:hypothetical protein
MQCQRCQREITEDESFTHLGQTLCEDCYLDIRQPVKACDTRGRSIWPGVVEIVSGLRAPRG